MNPSKAGVIEIYTDGACKGNPGMGGWGALLECDGHRRELFGGEKRTTNNRMELLAVIRALEALNKPSDVRIRAEGDQRVDTRLEEAELADRGQEAGQE